MIYVLQVKLTDALVSSLKFAKTRVPETEVAWLDARVLPLPSASADARTAATGPDAAALQLQVPMLGPLARPPPLRPAVLLCEPRLSDLKQALVKRGIPAELSAGHLLVNGVISIRKARQLQQYTEVSLQDYNFFLDFEVQLTLILTQSMHEYKSALKLS